MSGGRGWAWGFRRGEGLALLRLVLSERFWVCCGEESIECS